MNKELFNLLARYNGAANEKMNVPVKSLTGDEWNRPLGGFFPSVRSVASHVYVADFTWLKRFAALRDFKTLGDGFFAKTYSFKEELFPAVEDYLARRPELDRKILDFVNEVSGEDLGKTLRYNDSQGKPFEKLFGGALLHMFNHGTHHRGMISLYLELLGRENDFSSITAIL